MPDYADGGLVALTRSLLDGLGARRDDDLPPLALLPPAELAAHRRVVLFVVDGLGANWLRRVSPDGVLAAHLRGSITSVFPSTTATAVTTLLTGATPAEHGLTGWFVYLAERQLIATPLPFRERAGGALREADIAALFSAPAMSSRLAVPAWVVQPRRLVDTAYTRHHACGARVIDYREPEQLFAATLGVLRGTRGPCHAYAYWPDLDGVAHDHGIDSTRARATLARFERGFEAFLERARGLGAMVLVTADHGFIDTRPETRLRLDRHPSLAACLARPLCGEPRTVYCYLRPGAEGDFGAYVDERLAVACSAIPAREFLDSGRLGPGAAHPRLATRVGDQVLMMKDRFVLTDRTGGERSRTQVGVHGGSTADEMLVPLVVVAG